MKPELLLLGTGSLADLTHSMLSRNYRVSHYSSPDAQTPLLAVVIQDEHEESGSDSVHGRMRQAGIPYLTARISQGEGIVGPYAKSDGSGCPQCAEVRRALAGRDRELTPQQVQRLLQGEDLYASSVTQRGLRHTAMLLTAEVERVMAGQPAYTEGSLYIVNMSTLETSLHPIVPDPLCTECSRLPDDSSEAARILLEPRLKPGPNHFRTRSLADMKNALLSAYMDDRTGLMKSRRFIRETPFADVVVKLPAMTGDEYTAGRSHSYEDSNAIAVLEGLERHCGITSRGKRTVIRGSYEELAHSALDPRLVGVHDEEQYADPDFPFAPFAPERKLNWVWGYSFTQQRPILVPEKLAYYSAGFDEDDFVYETSNGCAIGGSLEEALLYGMLETVERDSFLMTWYAQLPLPRLDPRASGDKELTVMVDRFAAITGYDVLLFNATMEHGIPSIWATAVNRRPSGARLLCAAGAHLDPVRAAKSAVHELGGMLQAVSAMYEEDAEAAERMFHDSTFVEGMEDHPLLYSLPQARERLGFLLDQMRPPLAFATQFPPRQKHADLTEDVKDMLETFKRLQLDVVVVNQTSPEIARQRLYAVKVLIPGMLPMTFGHRNRRLHGLHRVLTVPATLGFARTPLRPEQLNPYPHAFP